VLGEELVRVVLPGRPLIDAAELVQVEYDTLDASGTLASAPNGAQFFSSGPAVHEFSGSDTLGHAFGDLVLCEFAHRLLSCVREMDTVARYGGEEFAVLLPDTDLEGGCRVAERVISVVRAEPFRRGELRQQPDVGGRGEPVIPAGERRFRNGAK